MTQKARDSLGNVRLFQIVVLMSCAVAALSDTVVIPALPALKRQFAHLDNVDLLMGFLLTMPALFIAIGAPIAGYIVDRFGRKKVLLASALMMGLGGISGLFTESIWVLLAGRAIVGLGIAGIMPTLTTLIVDYFEGETRATMFGYQAAAIGTGGTIFLLLSGALADIRWNGSWLLYVYPLLLLPIMAVVIKEPPRSPANMGDNHDEAAPLPSVKFPVQMMVFVYGMVFMGQVLGFNISAQVPYHLENISSTSAGQIGIIVAANAVMFAIGSASAGWFYRHFSPLRIITIALPIIALGAFCISIAPSWHVVVVGLALNGFGFGIWVPNMGNWLANNAHESQRGRILGGFNTAILSGQFVAPIVSTPIVNATDIPTLFAGMSATFMVVALTVYVWRASLLRWTTQRADVIAAPSAVYPA